MKVEEASAEVGTDARCLAWRQSNDEAKPLGFRINNQRVLYIGTNASGAPNLIAGSPTNNIRGTNIEGATIASGGLGLYPNTVAANYATIGGGTFHTVSGAQIFYRLVNPRTSPPAPRL